MGKVFYQRAAEVAPLGGLPALSEATFRRLVTFGLPPMLFLSVAGRDLFALVFGAEWADAGIYIQILAIWAFCWFVTSPLSTLTLVLGKQRFFLGWNIINFATRFLSLWIGGTSGSPILALALFAVSGVIIYGFLSFYLLQKAGVPVQRTMVILGKGVLSFLPIAAVMLFLILLDAPLWLEIGLPALLVGVFLLYSFRAEPRIRQVLERFGLGRVLAAGWR
jgi:O-antigen/teichoic acid export membrane protein